LNKALIGFRLIERICQSLSPKTASFFIKHLAGLYAKCDARRAEIVLDNLSALAGDEIAKSLVPKVYENFGLFMYEFFSQSNSSYTNEESLKPELLTQLGSPGQKANLLLTAHMGNWELDLKFLLNMGYRITTIALEHSHPEVDVFFDKLRSHPNLSCHDLKRGLSSCRKALQQKEIVALACDRDILNSGVTLDYRDHRFSLPLGPSWLIQRMKPDVFTIQSQRTDCGTFHCRLKPLDHSRLDGDIESITHAWGKQVFHWVESHPEQWLTFDRIFNKAKPAS
jgi:lauroyl/myristoyl acyltransferase